MDYNEKLGLAKEALESGSYDREQKFALFTQALHIHSVPILNSTPLDV